jgi:hypothetical protein
MHNVHREKTAEPGVLCVNLRALCGFCILIFEMASKRFPMANNVFIGLFKTVFVTGINLTSSQRLLKGLPDVKR